MDTTITEENNKAVFSHAIDHTLRVKSLEMAFSVSKNRPGDVGFDNVFDLSEKIYTHITALDKINKEQRDVKYLIKQG
jgi:hypothetical protein